jgi:hypothetical protein
MIAMDIAIHMTLLPHDDPGASPAFGDRFAAHTGFDPRALATPYRWFRICPRRIQAWREVNELPGRELMRDGRWLV